MHRGTSADGADTKLSPRGGWGEAIHPDPEATETR